MGYSVDVVAGDDILAVSYNNLRKDVVDTTGGHDHDGADSKTLTLNTAIPAVTATPTEINQALDGIAAGVTFTNLNTLNAGATSDADALHTHPDLVTSFYFALPVLADATSRQSSGFSDATVKTLSVGGKVHASTQTSFYALEISNDFGSALFPLANSDTEVCSASDDGEWGNIYIGTNHWHAAYDGATAKLYKDGSGVTFSGGDIIGPLGHDPDNAYLLILSATNKITRYSGIAGTTITKVDEITLDTAVTREDSGAGGKGGFLFDNVNNRFICIDDTNNLLRRFDISGNTIDTVAYTVTDTNVKGLAIINNRIFLVMHKVFDSGSQGVFMVTLIPTTMTR